MSADLKLTFRVVLAAFLLAETLALAGFVQAPHALFLSELSIANLGTYGLFVVVLYAFSRPGRSEAGKVAGGGLVLAAMAFAVEYARVPHRPLADWLFVAAAGFGAAAMAAFLVRLKRGQGDAALTKDLVTASVIAPLADPTVSSYLHLTQVLHPVTFDVAAYRFDAMLGFQPSAILAQAAGHTPVFMAVLVAAYLFQPYGVSLLYALQRTAGQRCPFSIIAFQTVSALLSAFLLYHLYPVAGPGYAFGAAFPAALPDASTLQETTSLVTRGARNGVPSMHFAWALALWLNARCLGLRWVTVLFAMWLALTVLATLALGEHYLLDLAVAVPLVVGVQALCMFGVPWGRERARAAVGGLGLTLAWILALRFAPGATLMLPGVSWGLMLATMIASVFWYRPLERMARVNVPVASPPARTRPAQPVIRLAQDIRLTLWIALGMLGVAETLALTGIIPAPHARYLGVLASPHALVILGSLATTFCILYLCARPALRDVVVSAMGAGLLLGAYRLLSPQEAARPWDDWLNLYAGAFAVSALGVLIARTGNGSDEQRRYTGAMMVGFLLILVYGAFAEPMLRLTAALHPVTYDAIAFNIDATLGFDPSIAFARLASQWPALREVVTLAYQWLPFGCAALYGLQLASRGRAPVSILLAFALSGVAALVIYHACPIAGPRYAFGEQYFAKELGAVGDQLVAVTPSPRNGLPSMHFGWALLLWLNAAFMGRLTQIFFTVFLGLTAIATLALGEHYLVDLVAAVPWIVALQALCATGMNWDSGRRRAVAAGLLLTIGWIVAVRYGLGFFQAVPGLTWVAVLGTLAASAWAYAPFARALRSGPSAVLREAPGWSPARPDARYAAWMFVISGFAALVYQVLFSKVLALTFGSQATATYTVLAVYMGGMALGAWLGGRLAARHLEPLKLYAWCELGIGAYCVATPLVFHGIQALYVAAAGGITPDAGVLTVLRVLLGVVALLVPTVLMGATLPVLARFLEGRAASLGVSVALLYGANTAGAALGALLAGYFLIPSLGVWKTTLAAAGLNFVVVWLAFRLQKKTGSRAVDLPSGSAAPGHSQTVAVESRRLGHIALVILSVGGAVTLALEVNYIHLLAVVAGNSVYAFSLMLFAFLLGLGAGAEGARRLLRYSLPLPLVLAWLEIALAAVILAGVYFWEGLPAYFASFESYSMTRGFGAREVVRGLVCFVAMFPPAVLIGAIYPVAMECVGRAYPKSPVAALGRAAALNTAGNIVGVLAAGFLLLPAIGALRSIQLLAVICLVVGGWIIATTMLRRRVLSWIPVVLVLGLLVVQPRSFDYTALASGANVYFAKQNFGRVIDHAESVDGGLTTVTTVTVPGKPEVNVLLTNGKFQGTNELKGEGVAQAGIALSPLLHTDARTRALVIGYGTGMTARVLHDAGFGALDVADLSADIVRLADRHFGGINHGVSARAGVNTYITDGRNFLMLQDRRYDVIGIEVSSIWFAGAASLYNREFYQLVKRRLAENGVLQQWVQLHHIQPRDILFILGSLRVEFRHIWIYEIGGQGVIIASNGVAAAPRVEYVDKLTRTAALEPLLALYGGGFGALRDRQLLDPAGVDRLLADFKLPVSYWISTDDNLILEYSTPKGNVLDGGPSFRRNIELLHSYATPRAGAFAGGSAP